MVDTAALRASTNSLWSSFPSRFVSKRCMTSMEKPTALSSSESSVPSPSTSISRKAVSRTTLTRSSKVVAFFFFVNDMGRF